MSTAWVKNNTLSSSNFWRLMQNVNKISIFSSKLFNTQRITSVTLIAVMVELNCGKHISWVIRAKLMISRLKMMRIKYGDGGDDYFVWVLTHWGRDKMAAMYHTAFSNAFSWMKMFKFRLRFHWSFFLKGPINNIPALVQIMAWRRPGDKPLPEPMMVNLLTHICVTRPQWVNKTTTHSRIVQYINYIAFGLGFLTTSSLWYIWIRHRDSRPPCSVIPWCSNNLLNQSKRIIHLFCFIVLSSLTSKIDIWERNFDHMNIRRTRLDVFSSSDPKIMLVFSIGSIKVVSCPW